MYTIFVPNTIIVSNIVILRCSVLRTIIYYIPLFPILLYWGVQCFQARYISFQISIYIILHLYYIFYILYIFNKGGVMISIVKNCEGCPEEAFLGKVKRIDTLLIPANKSSNWVFLVRVLLPLPWIFFKKIAKNFTQKFINKTLIQLLFVQWSHNSSFNCKRKFSLSERH